ncbi:MAG TPA: DUF1704 domain-containing protein [Myxococcota bacterium]|nr:DUF1704 domain-containing protein [Myxococcota bacterium]
MLPVELVEADAKLYALLQKVSFSRHVNPINGPTAQYAFMSGAELPPLLYDAPVWADDALELLRGLRIPRMHPLGQLLSQEVAEISTLIMALKLRSAEAFSELNRMCGWAPLRLPMPTEEDGEEVERGEGCDAIGMRTVLEEALRARDLDQWRVEMDPVMSARILVDAPKRLIRVRPSAKFTGSDLRGLVAHEIDVHVLRGHFGGLQPLRIFSAGLPGADVTEEGLAILAEERVGALSPRFLWRQWLLHEAIFRAETAGFREVYEWVAAQAGTSVAWALCLRIKRGLAQPGKPGVYAKDCIYLRGYLGLRRWIAEGGDLRLLYVGKVGVQHPVQEWLEEGWVRMGIVPALWQPPPRD